MNKQEIKNWLNGKLNGRELAFAEMKAIVLELNEAHELTSSHDFLYELAYQNSELAFLFGQSKVSPQILNESNRENKTLAFRLFNVETKTNETSEERVTRALIVCGIKKKAYELAFKYAHERQQGGRLIKDWSLIQKLLSELYFVVKADEAIVSHMDEERAFFIFKNCDQFISLAMQVLGGAGYTEDYQIERLFRECHFLKNWPRPYLESAMEHYQKVMVSP